MYFTTHRKAQKALDEIAGAIALLSQITDEQLEINKKLLRRIESLEQALDNGLPLY